jgi:hypothetical protein
MQIGTVAKRIGLTPDAIRFYERNELLPRPPRTEGGFRLYGESDVETLPSYAGFRAWDSSSARFGVCWISEEAVCSDAHLCGVDCRQSSSICARSFEIFRSLSTTCVRLYRVVIPSCESKMRTARFCETRTRQESTNEGWSRRKLTRTDGIWRAPRRRLSGHSRFHLLPRASNPGCAGLERRVDRKPDQTRTVPSVFHCGCTCRAFPWGGESFDSRRFAIRERFVRLRGHVAPTRSSLWQFPCSF